MSLPANTSELKDGDWDCFDQNMQAMRSEMQQLGPEFERDGVATLAQLDPQQIDEIHRQARSAAKTRDSGHEEAGRGDSETG